jgi:hypothetical protein
MCKATLLFAILLATSTIPAQAQNGARKVLLTKDNWAAVHAHSLKPQGVGKPIQSTNRIQIGVFTATMWLDGSAMYEFDWVNPNSGPCPGPQCVLYTPPLEFSNISVQVRGTTANLGPFSETEGFGIAWIDFLGYAQPLDNCQSLTFEGYGSINGYGTTMEKSSCIDVALQLTFATDPYTFTQLNGYAFTTYGIANNFITPEADQADLYSQCLIPPNEEFCGGPTIPVYVKLDKQ